MDNFTATINVDNPKDVDSHESRHRIQLLPILILMPLSVGSNILLMTTIVRCRHLHTISNALLLVLGFVDLLFALLVLPPWAAALWRYHLPSVLCKAVALITMMLFLQSILTIACISLDRYLRICHPMHYQQMVTRQRAVMVMLVTLVQAFLLSTAPLMDFGHYTFQPSSLIICSAQFPGQRGFSSLVLGTTILPSCLIIIICYWKIFRAARRQARRIADIRITVQKVWPLTSRRVHPPPAPLPPVEATSSTSSSSCSINHPGDDDTSSFTSSVMRVWRGLKGTASQTGMRTREMWRRAVGGIGNSLKVNRSLKTVLTVIGCFLACWLPYITQLAYLSFRAQPLEYSVEYTVTFLAFSSSIVNPLSCALINKDYRTALLLSLGIGRLEREREIMHNVVQAMTPCNPSEVNDSFLLTRVRAVNGRTESGPAAPQSA